MLISAISVKGFLVLLCVPLSSKAIVPATTYTQLGHLQKGALTTAEVCEALGLAQLKGRKWHVQGAIAIKGEGLYEGLDW